MSDKTVADMSSQATETDTEHTDLHGTTQIVGSDESDSAKNSLLITIINTCI